MIENSRIQVLNDHAPRPGDFVLYWMQASQRTRFNFALEHAIATANRLRLPVVVLFGLMDDYPEANERHYAFMLQGLADVHAALALGGIKFVVRHGHPAELAIEESRRAAVLICDRGYLRHQRKWRDDVADRVSCRVEQVEGDVVVPIEEASDKLEFAARTLRPKITRLREKYLKPLRPLTVQMSSTDMKLRSDIDLTNPVAALGKLKLDRSVRQVRHFQGGEAEAQRRLKTFIDRNLGGYATGRREPAARATSTLAPYLHFGQVSPVDIAIQVRASHAPKADVEAFLEELIVRRELSMNFVFHHPHYDQYDALPAWAKKSLESHRHDKRYHVYTRQELQEARTHDELWNAAQREMNATGFMQNSMRMYWGKKVLEWKATPQEAYEDLLYLNNRYFLCGRDPTSYANIGWIFGLHDRPWQNRPIFGNVRYMNEAGLRRKFDMPAYLAAVDRLERDAE